MRPSALVRTVPDRARLRAICGLACFVGRSILMGELYWWPAYASMIP